MKRLTSDTGKRKSRSVFPPLQFCLLIANQSDVVLLPLFGHLPAEPNMEIATVFIPYQVF